MLKPEVSYHWLDLTHYPRRLLMTGFERPRVKHYAGEEGISAAELAARVTNLRIKGRQETW